MSLRNLMTKKKAESRISHAFAKYNSVHQLSCSLCSTPIKHEQLWAAHLTSKGHRANAQAFQAKQEEEARLKQEAARIAREEAAAARKRSAEDAELEQQEATKRARQESSEPVQEPAEEVDEEWAAFERDILAEPLPSTSRLPPGYVDGAVITAKPKMIDEDGNLLAGEEGEEILEEEEEPEPDETEDEKKARIDNEELMARIEEEEREQQEADQRVVALKSRIEHMRQKRKGKV